MPRLSYFVIKNINKYKQKTQNINMISILTFIKHIISRNKNKKYLCFNIIRFVLEIKFIDNYLKNKI